MCLLLALMQIWPPYLRGIQTRGASQSQKCLSGWDRRGRCCGSSELPATRPNKTHLLLRVKLQPASCSIYPLKQTAIFARFSGNYPQNTHGSTTIERSTMCIYLDQCAASKSLSLCPTFVFRRNIWAGVHFLHSRPLSPLTTRLVLLKCDFSGND